MKPVNCFGCVKDGSLCKEMPTMQPQQDGRHGRIAMIISRFHPDLGTATSFFQKPHSPSVMHTVSLLCGRLFSSPPPWPRGVTLGQAELLRGYTMRPLISGSY